MGKKERYFWVLCRDVLIVGISDRDGTLIVSNCELKWELGSIAIERPKTVNLETAFRRTCYLEPPFLLPSSKPEPTCFY